MIINCVTTIRETQRERRAESTDRERAVLAFCETQVDLIRGYIELRLSVPFSDDSMDRGNSHRKLYLELFKWFFVYWRDYIISWIDSRIGHRVLFGVHELVLG